MKHLLLLVFPTFLFIACNQSPTKINQVKYDSLLNVLNERDESITTFMSSFNEIERNLDSISIKQQIISLNSNNFMEFSESKKDRINNEIKLINALMNKNTAKIDLLTKKFKAASNKNEAMRKTIKTLTNQLVQKQNELMALNKTLSSLNSQIDKLETSVQLLTLENGIQADVIDYTITTLQTAYYVVGQSKTLLDNKIIDKKGRLLGIGKTTEISADVDNKKFTKIDYSATTVFPINNKGIKIITKHPTKSYVLEYDTNDLEMILNLKVTNPDIFWSVSKYLVIVVK